jgi:hypothetical protein
MLATNLSRTTPHCLPALPIEKVGSAGGAALVPILHCAGPVQVAVQVSVQVISFSEKANQNRARSSSNQTLMNRGGVWGVE